MTPVAAFFAGATAALLLVWPRQAPLVRVWWRHTADGLKPAWKAEIPQYGPAYVSLGRLVLVLPWLHA